MKVLVLVPRLDRRGGIANYYNALRPYLRESVVYHYRGSRDGVGGISNVWQHLADYASFARTLRRGRFELVHINTSLGRLSPLRDGIFLLLASMLGVRTMVFFRGWDPRFAARLTGWRLALYRWAFHRAASVVVLAREFAALIRTWGYEGPVLVESTVVDAAILSLPQAPKRPRDGEVRVLFLARMQRDKGIFELLDAYALARQRLPGLRLTAAGDGIDFAAVRRRAAELDLDIDLPGYVRDAEKLRALSESDIYVLPTYREGMPNSVLEAMAAGLPVICHPVGGLRDFFEDGAMGFAIGNVEPEGLAELIVRLAADPERRRAISAFNRDYASSHFAAPQVAQRLEAIYASLSAQPAGAR